MTSIDENRTAQLPPRADSARVAAEAGGLFDRWRAWLLGFRRITSSGDYIAEIDGLRFIAIAAVVIDHVSLFVSNSLHQPPGVFGLGSRGVELFFAISGFILALPFAAHFVRDAKRVRLKNYFIRRVTRLEPPYLISLLLLAVLKSLQYPGFVEANWKYLGYSALYIHGFMTGRLSDFNVVAWSLEIEVQFYILMPLLALVFVVRNRWLRRSILLALMFAPLPFQLITHPTTLFPNQLHLLNEIQYFVAGILLADVFVTEWRNAPPPLRARAIGWGDIVWLIGWPLYIWIVSASYRAGDRRTALELYTSPPLIFLLYFSMFHSVWARRLMRVPEIAIIGGMCYSIYLIHNSVIQGMGRMLPSFVPSNYYLGVAIAALVMVPAVLIVCGLFFRLIERPCMRRDWPQQLRARLGRILLVEEEEAAAAKTGDENV